MADPQKQGSFYKHFAAMSWNDRGTGVELKPLIYMNGRQKKGVLMFGERKTQNLVLKFWRLTQGENNAIAIQCMTKILLEPRNEVSRSKPESFSSSTTH